MLSVIGYQLRVPIYSLGVLWPNERRSKYLLNEAIQNPLSADSAVWPILNDPNVAKHIFKDFSSRTYVAPNGLCLYQLDDFWFNSACSLIESGVIVGVCTENEKADYLRTMHFVNKGNTEVGGKFLGFDVCDDWLTSGLVNCSFERIQQLVLRDRFCRQLNHYGLFDAIDIAHQYSDIISKLIPTHAPFFPVGVFCPLAA